VVVQKVWRHISIITAQSARGDSSVTARTSGDHVEKHLPQILTCC